MFGNEERRRKRLAKLNELADTPDKKIEKLSYKEKQRVYAAKSSLAKVFWNSNKGTYIKPKEGVSKND